MGLSSGLALMIAGFLLGCADATAVVTDPDPEIIFSEFKDIYRSWTRAPGYSTRTISTGPHGDEVDIFVNDIVETTLAAGPSTEWAVGSIIVKDGYDSVGDISFISFMKKEASGWYYAEQNASGRFVVSGTAAAACISCHVSTPNDSVLAFDLPTL